MQKINQWRLFNGLWGLIVVLLLMLQPAIYQEIIKASLTPSMAYVDALLAGELGSFISRKLIWTGIFLILAFLGQLFLYFLGNKQLLGFLKRESQSIGYNQSLKRLTWAYYGLIWLMAGALLAVLLILIIQRWQIYQLSGDLGHYDVQATAEQVLDKLRGLGLQSLGDMEATLKACWTILKENAPLYKVLREMAATLTQIEQIIRLSYMLLCSLGAYLVFESGYAYWLERRKGKKTKVLLLEIRVIDKSDESSRL